MCGGKRVLYVHKDRPTNVCSLHMPRALLAIISLSTLTLLLTKAKLNVKLRIPNVFIAAPGYFSVQDRGWVSRSTAHSRREDGLGDEQHRGSSPKQSDPTNERASSSSSDG
jgi:hypothetical protein